MRQKAYKRARRRVLKWIEEDNCIYRQILGRCFKGSKRRGTCVHRANTTNFGKPRQGSHIKKNPCLFKAIECPYLEKYR